MRALLGGLDHASSWLATLVRPAGVRVRSRGARPKQRLELFEFEGCPFCRKVREALTELDLEAQIYPCPRKGPRFRHAVKQRGGKQQFPFLVDRNFEIEMYESSSIVAYLYAVYGDGRVPWRHSLGPIGQLSAALPTWIRYGRGIRYVPARAPDRPLELWSFEASPEARLVRERLCSLELPYVLHNVGVGSPGRAELLERAGELRVPYLVDPNVEIGLGDWRAILAHLDRTYRL